MTPTRRVQTPRRPYSRMWESAKRRSTSWLHRGHLRVPPKGASRPRVRHAQRRVTPKGASRPKARHAQRRVTHWHSTRRARRGGRPRGPVRGAHITRSSRSAFPAPAAASGSLPRASGDAPSTKPRV